MPMTAGERLGAYEILAPIGAGGMGEVYRARDTKLKRDVAIKVLPDSFAHDADRMARFQREAEVLASLNHPNIAQIYGVEERALVMELIEGENLKGPLPIETAVNYASQIALALEAAHDKGIVHRDLKPGNIKITPEGIVKVLDFGLAKTDDSRTTSDASNSPTLTIRATEAGLILGTASYMSPEQAAGKPVDKRADIWSFGVVLYEMLTGRRLFEGETLTHTLADVLRAPIDFDKLPKETPRTIRDLLDRCLDRDVKTRLRDIGEARIALQKYFADPRHEDPPLAVAQPTPRIWRWLAVAAVVLIVALGAIAVMYFREAPPRQHVRFQVAPPEGALLDFKLSPDGRFLAFLTRDGATGKIWIRTLDSLDTRLITSFSIPDPYLFWSGDGEYLGFSAVNKLYKIPRTGGQTATICDLPGGAFGGADWGTDGKILFSTNLVLYRVASSGGTPDKVTLGMGSTSPAWLTRDTFLFATSAGIFVGSLSGAKPSRLLPDASNPVFVPPGRACSQGCVLFVRQERVMAQPLDSSKAELRGEAFPLAEHVGDSLVGGGPFSASRTGVLVFGSSVSQDRELVWMDRTGKKMQTVSRPFSLAPNPAIRLSPEDSRALVPVASGNTEDLWIADLNRHSFSRFTFDGAIAGLWSPDGSKVLWAASDGKRYVRSADGSGADELLFKVNCDTCYPYDWSSDGKRIAFTELAEKTQLDIWLVNTDGDHKPYPYLQTRFIEGWAQFSPDGRWMAYASDQPGQLEIMVESIPAGKGRWQISTEGGDWPEWRRDGKELFFLQGTKIMAVPIHLTDASVEREKPRPLFDIPAATRFQVSGDGQHFLIAMPVEGQAATPLTVDTDWRPGLTK